MRSMKSGRYHRRIITGIFVFLTYIEIIDGQGFMFNNQLAVIANDCYTRVAIGSRLPEANTTTVQVATVSDCEDACSANRTTCKSISFGIGVRGNASCMLGNQVPTADTLQTDGDYDVYIRTQKTPHCEADRLFSLNNAGQMQMQMPNNNMTAAMPTINFMNNQFPMQPGVIFQSSRPNGDRRTGSTLNQRWFPTNDADFRSYDIERNKNSQKDTYEKSSTHDSNYNSYNRFDKIGEEDKTPGFLDKLDYGSFFGHKIGTVETTKDDGTNGFGSFSIGKNFFPTDYAGSSKPIVQQSYLTIAGKPETGGRKGFDLGRPVYTEVPFVTKSLDKPPMGSYGFVIEHGADKVGYSGINSGGSGQRTDVGVRPISILEFHGIDRAKSMENSDDNGSRYKVNLDNDRGIHRYSTPVSIRTEPENDRFRQTAQLPDTSVFKYPPERSYPHYATGENDGGHGIGSTKCKLISALFFLLFRLEFIIYAK